MNYDIIKEMNPEISDNEAKIILLFFYSIPIVMILMGSFLMVGMVGIEGVSFMLGGSLVLAIPMAYYLELKARYSGKVEVINGQRTTINP